MEFIVTNWFIIIAAIAVLGAAVYAGVRYFKLPSESQITKVREWLLYAVIEAESALGGGTGKLKLRYVYDMFIERFAWLSRVLTFDRFSELVDDALEEMRFLLKTNDDIASVVDGEKE